MFLSSIFALIKRSGFHKLYRVNIGSMKASVVALSRVATLCSLLVLPRIGVKADEVTLAPLKPPEGLKITHINSVPADGLISDTARKEELHREMHNMMCLLLEQEALQAARLKGPNVTMLRDSIEELRRAYDTKDRALIEKAGLGYLRAMIIVERSRKGLFFSGTMLSVVMATVLFLRPKWFLAAVDSRIARAQGIHHKIRNELESYLTAPEVGLLRRVSRGVKVLSYLAHHDTDTRRRNSKTVLAKYKMFTAALFVSSGATLYGYSHCAVTDLGFNIGAGISWAIGIIGIGVAFYSPLYRSASRAVDTHCTERLRQDVSPVGK